MARVLNGKQLAVRLNRAMKHRVDEVDRAPGLAVVLVGADPASEVYVAMKGRVAHRIGFHHRQIDFPADISQDELLATIDELNNDEGIDGILVQLPLPKHLNSVEVMDRISPAKDVDGFSAINSGLLAQGRPSFVPCTPWGVIRMLEDVEVELSGLHAVVIGRSNIVGRPMAYLLEQRNCTVTVCHSRTRDVAAHLATADLIIAAVGRPHFVKAEWLKPGCVVVDVGVNRLEDGRLVGDVDYEASLAKADWITPVPGGVGPMTIAMLMENTWKAYCLRQGISTGL